MRRHAFFQRVTWQNVHLSNSQKGSLKHVTMKAGFLHLCQPADNTVWATV